MAYDNTDDPDGYPADPSISGLLTRIVYLEDQVAESDRNLSRMDTRLTSDIVEMRTAPSGVLATPEGVLARLEDMERKVAEVVLASPSREVNELAKTLGDELYSINARLEQAVSEPYEKHGDTKGASDGALGKVLELMKLVTTLEKDKTTDKTAGGFKFRSIDAAMDAVGQAMRTVGLILSTAVDHVDRTQYEMTNRDGKTLTWTSAYVTVTYTFIDPGDGSSHRFQMVGEGRDATDKATSKAVSMALKYGLLQALMIGVTDLPDTDSDGGGQIERTGRPATAQGVDRTVRAQGAKDAIDKLATRPRGEALSQLLLIEEQCAREGLMSVEVRGATVESWIATARQVLTGWESTEEPPAVKVWASF